MNQGTINQLIMAICNLIGTSHRPRLEGKSFDEIVNYAVKQGIDVDIMVKPISEISMDKQRTTGKTTVRAFK